MLLIVARCRLVELAAILCKHASLSPDGRSSGADGAERVVAVLPSARGTGRWSALRACVPDHLARWPGVVGDPERRLGRPPSTDDHHQRHAPVTSQDSETTAKHGPLHDSAQGMQRTRAGDRNSRIKLHAPDRFEWLMASLSERYEFQVSGR
jgi:hypothetical protein